MAILDQSPELVVTQSRKRQRMRHLEGFRPTPHLQSSPIGMSLGTAAGVLLILLCGSSGGRAMANSSAPHSAERGAPAIMRSSGSAGSAISQMAQTARPVGKATQQAIQVVPASPAMQSTPWDGENPAATTSTTNASDSSSSPEEKSAPGTRTTQDESKQRQELKPAPVEKPHIRPAHPVKRIPRFILARSTDSTESEILKLT